MKKTVFFLFGTILGIVAIIWMDGYTAIPKEERPGFAKYVKEDVKDYFDKSKEAAETLPNTFNSVVQNQRSINDMLLSQIKKGLQAHYLINGKYPMSLSSVIDPNDLPKDMEFYYESRGDAYVLRVFDKQGNMIMEIVEGS